MTTKLYVKQKIYDKPKKCEGSLYNVWRAPSPATTDILHEKVNTVLHIMVMWKTYKSKNRVSMKIIKSVKKNLCQTKNL